MSNFIINTAGSNQWYLIPVMKGFSYDFSLIYNTDPSYSITNIRSIFKRSNSNTFPSSTQFTQLQKQNFPTSFWDRIQVSEYNNVIINNHAIWANVDVVNFTAPGFFGHLQNWALLDNIGIEQLHDRTFSDTTKSFTNTKMFGNGVCSEKTALTNAFKLATNNPKYAGIVFWTDISSHKNINNKIYLFEQKDLIKPDSSELYTITKWSSWCKFSLITSEALLSYDISFWENQFDTAPSVADRPGTDVPVNRVIWLKSRYISKLVAHSIHNTASAVAGGADWSTMTYSHYSTQYQSSNTGRGVYGWTSWMSGWGPYITNGISNSPLTDLGSTSMSSNMPNVLGSNNINYFVPHNLSEEPINIDAITPRYYINAIDNIVNSGDVQHNFLSTYTTPTNTTGDVSGRSILTGTTTTISFTPSDISNTAFNLQNFTGATLHWTSITNSHFINCMFRNTNIGTLGITNTSFVFCDFTNTNLDNVTFHDTNIFINCIFSSDSWTNTSVVSAYFDNCIHAPPLTDITIVAAAAVVAAVVAAIVAAITP